MNRRSFLLGGAVAAAVIAAASAMSFGLTTASLAESQPMALPADPEALVAVTANGEVRFRIEVADDPAERAMGLMFRTDLGDDQGMLFVFDETQPVGFWMKNTPLPLDLLFVGEDGKVRDIQQGQPFSEAVIAPGEPVRFVLELKAGTAEKSGIRDGDQLRHRVITEAGAANPG